MFQGDHSDWTNTRSLDANSASPALRLSGCMNEASLEEVLIKDNDESTPSILGFENRPIVPLDLPRTIYLQTAIACLVNFTVGFSTSIIAPALIFIEESMDTSVAEISAIVSFALLGGLIGSVLSGWTSDLVGRRMTMNFGAAIMASSSLACAWSRNAKELILSRFLQGLGTSMSVVVAGVIITELSPTHIRGMLGSASQNFLAVGLIASGFTGYLMHVIVDTNQCWRPMFLVAAAAGIISLVTSLLFLEESPRWLASKHQIEKARTVLRKIYGDHNREFVDEELHSFENQHRHLAEVACFDIQDLTAPIHRRPLFITCALKFIQQLTGTAVIVSYMVVIFTNTGASREDALLFTALSSLPQLVTMFLGSYLLDFTGRKQLLLLSQIGIIVILIIMGIFRMFDGSWQTKAMIFCVVMFRVFYSLGMGPIPLVLASEILPFKIRGRGLAFSTLLHSILGFLLTASFPTLIRIIGEALFYWILAAISIGGYMFIKFKVEETTNIRLEDLEAINHASSLHAITFHSQGQPPSPNP